MLTSPLFAEGERSAFALVVEPWWVLVSIVQFLVLFFLLRKILWGPVTQTLQARADRIREGLEAAEAIGRNPDAAGAIRANLILGAALAEGLGILSFVLGVLLWTRIG